ncbi:glycosyltransferase family 4 protein [Rufibacter latericius]|uniref:Glycosyltransferase n=1 Tax=Rufibacter latericius TaxID=2487040 RepID=A0A3M9MJM8_9BACT|nr:glycosyltransferase family 4 protein [Rufibacter latericius]RNI25759.1 glycosyltransferase [Rufibacter latericius]
MKVLHCFGRYLPITENWVFRLLSFLPDVQIIITANSFLKGNFYNKEFKYIEFPATFFKQPAEKSIFTIRILNALTKVIRKFFADYIVMHSEDVDFVHSHFAPTAWAYHDIAKRLNVPHVISFYGYDYEMLPFTEPIWESRYQQMFKEAALFICEGSHGARVLIDKGCPVHKVKIIKLGVEIDRIPFTSRKKETNTLKLLQIASLKEKKGHVFTVKAFLNALYTCPNAELTLVGGNINDPMRSQLEEMVRAANATDKVFFVESIDFKNLYSFMENYHVFIHPSCYAQDKDCEGGAPVVLLDAQATGMPIISTRHCDIPDEVIHGETGLLAQEKNIDELAQFIQTFYEMDQAKYNLFATQARKHVEKNFDVSLTSRDLSKIYVDLKEKTCHYQSKR